MTDPFVAAACRSLAAAWREGRPASVLLAVSGGADSVALLDALWTGRRRRDLKGITFAVGHFDHRLRAGSARDRELVAAHAAERGLPFVTLAATHPLAGRGGLEESARDARYQALQAMARELDCQAIVTAHTATDQAETLLWRLARGAGARGLGAMRPSRKLGGLRLLRPLLSLTREETRAYCARRGLTFHDDPTNLDHRPRARLRAEVLPVLERLSPGAIRRLADAAGRLRADDDYLEARAARLTGEGAAEDIHSLAALPEPLRRRALARWVAAQTGTRRRLTATHLKALEKLVQTGRGEVDLPAADGQRCVAVVAEARLTLRTVASGQRGLHRFGAAGV